jgi:hypothetical protein
MSSPSGAEPSVAASEEERVARVVLLAEEYIDKGYALGGFVVDSSEKADKRREAIIRVAALVLGRRVAKETWEDIALARFLA